MFALARGSEVRKNSDNGPVADGHQECVINPTGDFDRDPPVMSLVVGDIHAGPTARADLAIAAVAAGERGGHRGAFPPARFSRLVRPIPPTCLECVRPLTNRRLSTAQVHDRPWGD